MIEVKLILPEEKVHKEGLNDKIRELSGFKNTVILEELFVKNPDNFGKGYGKKAFLDLLKEEKRAIALYPFSVFFPDKDKAFAGRIPADNIDLMEKGVEELKNKFYIPLIKKSGRKFKIIKTEYHEIIVIFPL